MGLGNPLNKWGCDPRLEELTLKRLSITFLSSTADLERRLIWTCVQMTWDFYSDHSQAKALMGFLKLSSMTLHYFQAPKQNPEAQIPDPRNDQLAKPKADVLLLVLLCSFFNFLSNQWVVGKCVTLNAHIIADFMDSLVACVRVVCFGHFFVISFVIFVYDNS